MFDYIFSIRPSTICNYTCSYCYRHDYINVFKSSEFNVDSMIWHAQRHENSLFNFCGFGETTLHPQFTEMTSKLSHVTKINWITNGTKMDVFFKHINLYNIKNIHDITISIHVDQIKNMTEYAKYIRTMHRLLLNEKIKTLIMQQANAGRIKQQAVEQGMRTLRQDGMLRALAGKTTVDEVLRVAQEEEVIDE